MNTKEKRYINRLIRDIYLSYKDEGKRYTLKQVREMHKGNIPIWIGEMETMTQ